MINIGTNFLYKGILFLDDRQGIARSKSDLLNWSIPVPEGFEVYLPLENDPGWYTYNSNYNSEETGHFERRLDKSYVDFRFNEVWTEIDNIWNGPRGIEALWRAIGNTQLPTQVVLEATFSTTNNGSGSSFYWIPQSGSTITPKVTWHLYNVDIFNHRTEIPANDVDSVKINNSEITKSNTWTGTSIDRTNPGNYTYTLEVTYNGTSYTKSQTYKIQYYSWIKFAGVSSELSITSLSQLQSPIGSESIEKGHGWSGGSINLTQSFNCSGGKYPYYIFPANLYNSTRFKIKSGGINFSDFIVSDPFLLSGSGYNNLSFRSVRTGYIQTSSLMEFEYYE